MRNHRYAISAALLSNVLTLTAAKHQYFTTTAVISNSSASNVAAFQCWRRPVPFEPYPTVGSSLPLANLTNATVVNLPRGGKEGLHKPPHPMLFVQLSGSATVTLPANPTDPGLRIEAGDVIVAVDVEGDGHWTEYGREGDAVALQLVLAQGWEEEWEVLYDGACEDQRAPDRIIGMEQQVMSGSH